VSASWGEGPEEAAGGTARQQARSHPHDPFEPPERSGLARGLLIVIVGVVLAVLLLPSATRAPLATVATSAPARAHHGHSLAPTSPPRSTTTTTKAPAAATIHVLVANATTVNGVAGSVTTFLGTKGFSTLTATNALTRLAASEIYYTATGSAADADEVASALGLAPAVVQAATATPPVASTTGASVIVIAGQDLATRFAPATTTTA
jgi:LytR cell envelope-related transcriptional attenuator